MQAWLTPNAAGGNTVRRVLVIPVELETSVNGALQELAEVYNWEPYGTMTPDEAAALADDMLEGYYMSIVGDDILGRNTHVALWAPTGFNNGWQWGQNPSSNNAGYWKTPDAATNNTYVEWAVYLSPGTYKVHWLATSQASAGDGNVKMDGTVIQNFSLYSASTTFNNSFITSAFTITDGGSHLLRYTITGKQPSSGGYRLYIAAIQIEWQP